jgi:NADP-dependent 3-hydroxy acid dehydrogenase YdfG
MQDVSGKVAFITGGASGMGLAMARSFSAAGMKVVIADVQQDALDAVKKEFAASNADVLTLIVDVTDRDAMEQAAQATVDKYGKVHVICNNAGVAVSGSIADTEYSDWDWVMGVNVNGVINGLQTFVNRIKEHGEGGHIVNTASMAGHIPVPGLGVYNTSKYAVVGMSEAMRLDLAADNIGVSVLCPGVVNTNIFDSERNRPGELASDQPATPLLGADLSDEEQQERMQAILAGALDPAVVGDMVLHAIQTDEFYIFTHPEIQEQVNERKQDLDGAFDRWRTYRSDHGV